MKVFSKIAPLGGWLGFADFCIFKTLIETQNALGNKNPLCEIGVHHGKSFIPMVLFSGDSVCHCVDVFEEQSLNVDSSGRGDYEVFCRNLAKFNISMDRVRVHKVYSTSLSRNDLCQSNESIRFFHIDGGHHLEVVTSDLSLALVCADKDSVIAIDDVCRSEWIEVSQGVFGLSSVLKDYGFTSLAFGFNKLYLCHESMISTYQQSLYICQQLQAFLEKEYEVKNISRSSLPIYSSFPLPEWTLLSFVKNAIKIKYPFLHLSLVFPATANLRKIKRLIKRTLRR
jgi:hypothetical protein